MLTNKRTHLLVGLLLLALSVLAACQPATETVEVEVTRVVTETVEVEGETVEVTRIVTETVVEEVVVEPEAEAVSKDLVICEAQEPDSLYMYGTSMASAQGVQHALFTSDYTNLSFGYQAEGLVKLPSLADGDAVVNVVEVAAGTLVRDAADTVVTLEDGVVVVNAEGEEVTFDGTLVQMEQMVVDFEMQPRIWSDGEPVKASDSVYSFGINADPDTPWTRYSVERTASYEATGDLSTRWTSLPGFVDATYFVNFWRPAPEHAWSALSAAELLEAEISSRMPVGDGAFKVAEWNAGDSIVLEPNEFYYRSDEGMPFLSSVTFKFIPDTNQLLAQLLSGACDIGTQNGMDVGQSPFLIEAETNGLLTPYFQTGTVYEHIDFSVDSIDDYGDDVGRPDFFEDVRVRQAMTMCTDRQSMVDNILYGRSEVIHTYVPQVHPLYPEGLTEWPFDIDGANALLDEAGYVDSDGDGVREYPGGANGEFAGEPFAVTLGTTTGNEMRQQLTQIFKENMLECGINIELYYLPPSEWFADGPDGPLFGRRFDLGEFAWLTGVEPSCNLYGSWNIPGPGEDAELYPSGWGGQNETGWRNAEFDAACQQDLGSLPSTAEYEDGHKEAQRIFS
ncbi:MAG: peptide ABC transporter substrate-binding protein, partial [Chloroflexi bacterium]